jgi:hypothetical protein
MNCNEEYEEWVTSLQKLKERTEKEKKYKEAGNKNPLELDLLI